MMKLRLLPLLVLPLTGITQSLATDPELQVLYSAAFAVQNDLGTFYGSFPDQKTINVQHVQQIICYFDKSGKRKEISEVRQYNQRGQLVNRERNQHHYSYMYDDSLLVSSLHTFKKKSWFVGYTYDDSGRVTEILRTNARGIPTSSVKMEYFELQKTSKITYTDLTKKQHVYVLEKEYDTLLRTLVRATYSVDGEIRKTWNYTCDEKGTESTPKTEELLSRCEFQSENADGSYSKFIRSVERGKSYLLQQDFSRDSVLTGLTRYLNDSIVVWRERISSNQYTFENYSQKGKLRSVQKTHKNDRQQVVLVESFNRKGKMTYSNELQYNEQQLIAEIHYTKSGSVLHYTYTFYPD